MKDDIHENRVFFRKAREDDANRIFEIDAVSFKKPYSLNTIIESVSSDIVIAAVDGRDTVLGYIIGVKGYDTIDIIRIAVAESYKRQGIGGKLLIKLIDEYEKFDFWLEVRENNTPAISLYEKNGFRQIGQRKGFYDEYEPPVNALTMKYYK
ncbi:MAG: ribosomal protein S18-alanine N-acetyltransferase [Ruminococcus sp.]|jgi:ribosomal-protein-alanine N-acetyltransferase|nr:ribosomal protein S18-alanine N-acetyltransferase [Ruminococcus sp.]